MKDPKPESASISLTIPPTMQLMLNFIVAGAVASIAILSAAGFFLLVEWEPVGDAFIEHAGQIAGGIGLAAGSLFTVFMYGVRVLESSHTKRSNQLLSEIKALSVNFNEMRTEVESLRNDVKEVADKQTTQELELVQVKAHHEAFKDMLTLLQAGGKQV